MTLKDYIQTLPKERVQRAAIDLDEATKIEQEHAALPGAVFDTPEQAEDSSEKPQQQVQNSFDVSSEEDTKKFIGGMELSHPELVNRLRRDEKAWDQMLEIDRQNVARMERDGGMKFSGDDKSDYEFYRWAYGRGLMDSDTSVGGIASAFGRGLWQMVKGAGKLAGTVAKSAANPLAASELAATTVDSAQSAVAEYQQLGAGLAALTSGDNPQVKMAAMYELAKFADTEQKNHNAWRKAVSDSFAEVPVDEDSVEFLSEAFDVSNIIGAGAGKLVTKGLKRVGASGAAEVLGASREMWGSAMAAKVASKIPVVGTPYKRAILVGQADVLSAEAAAAYEQVAKAQADLAAKRATLTASPASSPKDVLLKEIADGEADLAKKQATYEATKAHLDEVRQGVSDTLDLEGRGLLNRTAAGTLEATGSAVAGTGRLMSRAYRGASELLTGEADNAAFDMAAGSVVGNVASKGNFITRVGNDLQIAGRTMSQNGSSIPYFRRLRQAEDATKLTRGAAAFIDWSHAGWAADKVGELGAAAAAGAPVSGAFGYVASGGDLAAAAESAGAGAAYGIGGGAYGQWQAYKDPSFRWQELLANRLQFRDTLSRREVNGQSQLKIFDQLSDGDQIAVATYAQGKPDVAFRFIDDPAQASGYYDRENNIVVINKASTTPVGDIFRHEIAHYVERHGLSSQIREMYLGDAEKGVIGQYTAMDKLGNPVFVESTGPDGETKYSYKMNEAGEKLKAEYEAKIRAVDPTFSMTPEYLASELFAEQYADRLMSGSFRRDMSRNAVDSIVDALASKPLLKEFLGGIGLLFDQNDNIVGTHVFTDLKRNKAVDGLITRWNSDVAKGKKFELQDKADDHVFTETELRDPTVATKWLQGGGAMRFGADGKPVYDSKGVPQFLTEKEADALQRDLANELITQIEKHVAENPGDKDVIQRREIVDVNGVKRTVFSGKRIPAAVIDALEAQKRFNPHQLAHLRAASASVEKHGVGAMIANFYQAATRKLGGKAYKTVGGRWRRDGVVGFQITKDGNVVFNTVSWEQLAENARKAAKTKLARETYATAGVPIDAAITADVKSYLTNLVEGKPGATDIGEARRDFINNLLGIRMAANAEANPLFDITDAPKTILTNLRLDRINRMAPLDSVEYAWGPQQYRQAKNNARPDVLPIPERFTGTGEEPGRQSKRVPADKTPGFFKKFNLDEYTKGGAYFDTATGEDVTGKVYESGAIDVSSGRPSLRTSDATAEPSNSGRKIRTNLFKESAGWKWVGEPPAKTSTLVSVEVGSDHFYTLNSTFGTPIEMARYEDKKSEPRLRPTTKGHLQLGNKVGEIEIRGRSHPVYDKITTSSDAPGRGIVNRGEDSLQFRPDANEETQRIAAGYFKNAFGREYDPHTTYDQAPTERLKEIADYFQNVAKHEPSKPEVRSSYEALARETIAQYKAMEAAGIKVEPYSGKGEPYASSDEMARDVRENKHLYFLRTEGAFGNDENDFARADQPLLQKSGVKIGDFELLVNDVFRAVHDYFGHTQQGYQFGPRGEFNAWRSHSRMYSDEAQGAVAAETLAQNAWVNFGEHLRREDGTIPQKGEEGYVPPQERPFGEQKNFVVPPEMMQFRPDDDEASRPRLTGGRRTPIKANGISYENITVGKSDASLPKVVLETNPSELFGRIDAAKSKIANDPMRLADERGWVEYFRDAGVWGDVLTAPPALRLLLERPKEYVDLLQGGYHGRLTKPGTMEAADAGLDATVEMRAAIKGRPPEMITAMHHLWGILSRMLPPVEQESAWLRLVSNRGILEQIQNSIDGSFSLTQEQWKAKVSEAMAATNDASGGRGNQGTANANAFYLMLANWNGMWGRVSDVYTADTSTQSGRNFWSLNAGPVGIKNKVQRFIGLTFGIPGLIMDRWKFVEFYYQQYGKAPQDYFKYSAFGTPEDPNGIYGAYGAIEGGNSAFSLAFYEGLESVLNRAIANSPELASALGRHANLGGLHWKGWNAIKNEAVGHSSLDLTYDLALQGKNPSIDDVLDQISRKDYYTEGLVGNRIVRFTIPKP